MDDLCRRFATGMTF